MKTYTVTFTCYFRGTVFDVEYAFCAEDIADLAEQIMIYQQKEITSVGLMIINRKITEVKCK